jgi:pimeloyl-ACP methyl ester carboxylesterase
VNAVLRLGLVAVSTYGLGCAVLYFVQDRLLYLPTPEAAHPGVAALRLERGAAALKVWELHGAAQPALIYFGGNAEDVGANIPDFDAAFPDRAVYLVNYRGYGGSTGRPSEAALIADAAAVFDLVSERHAPIAVMGRSLGSGVAVALATVRPVERLILVTPFDSIAAVAGDHFHWVPARALVRDRYDSAARIGRVSAPTLVVVAEHDEVVFRARSDSLTAAIAPALRHTMLVPGATHNDVQLSPLYYPAVRAFLYRAP